jgi:hypothetical protein
MCQVDAESEGREHVRTAHGYGTSWRCGPITGRCQGERIAFGVFEQARAIHRDYIGFAQIRQPLRVERAR